MTSAELRIHACALVGAMAASDLAEAEAIIEEMRWQVRNRIFQATETARGPIRLVRPLEGR